MKPRVLLVDGHSMIFQWPDLLKEHQQNTATARESLIRMLTGLQDSSDWHVAVVFDGKGTRTSEANEPYGIQVFFSRSGQTADSVIERITARYATEYDVTVATNDTLERTTVASLGASGMSAIQLREEIERTDRDMRSHLGRRKR